MASAHGPVGNFLPNCDSCAKNKSQAQCLEPPWNIYFYSRSETYITCKLMRLVGFFKLSQYLYYSRYIYFLREMAKKNSLLEDWKLTISSKFRPEYLWPFFIKKNITYTKGLLIFFEYLIRTFSWKNMGMFTLCFECVGIQNFLKLCPYPNSQEDHSGRFC